MYSGREGLHCNYLLNKLKHNPKQIQELTPNLVTSTSQHCIIWDKIVPVVSTQQEG